MVCQRVQMISFQPFLALAAVHPPLKEDRTRTPINLTAETKSSTENRQRSQEGHGETGRGYGHLQVVGRAKIYRPQKARHLLPGLVETAVVVAEVEKTCLGQPDRRKQCAERAVVVVEVEEMCLGQPL